MLYSSREELGFDDVLIKPEHSNLKSRQDVDPYTSYGNYRKCTPYFVTNMSSVGNIKSAKYLYSYSVPVAIHKYVDSYELESHLDSPSSKLSFVTVGLDDYSIKHIPLVKKYGHNLLIDVPNGYISVFYELCKKLRNECPDTWIMAGNVVDISACIKLSKIGINCARIGIGGGSVCRTSNKTGVGRKPISAIMECCQSDIKICWDGGIRSSSDICKALDAGASYVSCGKLFASFKEINHNEPVNMFGIDSISGIGNHKRLPFYGMSSEHANEKYAGGLKEYRAAEGVVEFLEIKDNPEAFIKDINGSIRSYMTYTGRKWL